MYRFLSVLDAEKLARIVRRSCAGLGSVNLDNANPSRLRAILFANHGEALLADKGARIAFLRVLDETTLREIGDAAGKPSDLKPVDLAVALGAMPWTNGGRLPAALAEVLDIPAAYLPRRGGSVEVIQQIVPSAQLPPLFSFQENVKQKLICWLAGVDSPTSLAALLQLPTGSGKTRTTLEAVILDWRERIQLEDGKGVLWLAHSEELCEQAAETFERLWTAIGSVPIDVVRYWGRASIRGYELSGSFIVAGYSKLTSVKKTDLDLYNRILSVSSICVVDEAHRALAPTIREVIKDFRSKKGNAVLGLTATPGRSAAEDSENRKLASLFDNRLIAADDLGLEPIAALQERGVLARVIREEIITGISVNESSTGEFDDLDGATLDRLARNAERNQLIVRKVMALIKNGRPTLVFSCTVDHARQLAALTALEGAKVGAVDCYMNTPARRSLVEQFRSGRLDALFNFGVLTTGFDSPTIGAIVIARPTTSIVLYSQMVGRALRGPKVGGTRDCRIVDIKDNFRSFGDLDTVYKYFEDYWVKP